MSALPMHAFPAADVGVAGSEDLTIGRAVGTGVEADLARTVAGAFLRAGHAPVVRAIIDAQTARRTTIVEVATLERVELVVDDTPWEEVARAARALDLAWRTVVVVVPRHRLGEAHRHLRGSGALLQPWWRAEGTVLFGGLEIP